MKNLKKRNRREMASIVFLSFCSALALTMRFALPKLSEAQQNSALSEIMWNLRESLSGTSVTSTLLFAGLVALGVFACRTKEEKCAPKALLPVCFMVALVWLMGAGFSIDNTLVSLDASPGQVVKSACYVLGSTYLLYQLGQLLFWFLERERPTELERKGKLAQLYRAHPFGVSFCAVLLCWLPYLIICYPGGMCYDAWNQLSQFFGILSFTSHHPPTHTLFLGGFVQLGRYLGSANMGLFLSVFAQALIEAAIFARGLSLMKKWQAPRWLIVGSILVTVTSPYYTSYMSIALKDNLYAAGVVLLMEEIGCMLDEDQAYFSSWRHWLALTAATLLIMLFRNNGKYVLYPTVGALLIYRWVTRKKTAQKRMAVRTAACLLAPILLANGVAAVEMAHYEIEQGSIREALSLPFQQTARYVKEYGNEVTEEEAAAIRAVLDYEHLAEKYNPRISDPVKGTYKPDATKKDLLNYFLVWFNQFWKHPTVYLKATANQNYYLLYPFSENMVVYESTMVPYYPHLEVTSERTGIHEVETLQDAKLVINGLCRTLFSLPVIGLLTHQASYNLLLLALIVFAIHNKKYKWLIAVAPIILSVVIIVLAPVIQGHPRYAFPIIYAMPIATAYYIKLVKSEKG